MVSSFICGSASFQESSDGERDHHVRSAGSTPRRSRIHMFHKDKKNPYSSRGRDKFSALLAEIQEKREKIYAELGGKDEISFVQFKYSSDDENDCKPIVVRLKPKTSNNNEAKDDQTKAAAKKTSKLICRDNNNKKKKPHRSKSGPLDTHGTRAAGTSSHVPSLSTSPRTVKASKETVGVRDEKKKENNLSRKLNLDRLRKPRYYLSAIVIMILLFLVLFGRSVAILCTSIGWYLVPTITNGSSSSLATRRKSFQKKKDNINDRNSFKMGNKGHHHLQGLASFKGHDRRS